MNRSLLLVALLPLVGCRWPGVDTHPTPLFATSSPSLPRSVLKAHAPAPAFNPAILKAGDVLLYAPTDLVGDIIAVKTGRLKSHIEAYVGDGKVFAAREEGVNIYPVRIDASLACVRRHPNWQAFDTNAAMKAISPLIGTTYGTWQLFSFFDPWHIPKEVVRVCSTVDLIYLRGGGLEPFNPDLDSSCATPGSWFETGGLLTVWRNADIDRLSPPRK